ncbi:MAG: hypothetical protein WAT91_16015 [Saprospiraceae bacterium]
MIQEKHMFPDFIKEIVVELPDFIETIDDYKRIIFEIAQLTGTLLNIKDVETFGQENEWTIKINFENDSSVCKVAISEYFDLSILGILNAKISNEYLNEERRLVDISGGSYDFAIAFTHPKNLQKLVKDNLIYRSDTWQKNQELLQIYESYNLKATQSGISLPERWVGFFRYLNKEEITLFKLIITKEENGEIEGIIHEGYDFHNEKDDFITFIGKRDTTELSFIKYYGDGLLKDLAQLMGVSENEIDSENTKTEVSYSGSIVNSNNAFGTWKKGETKILFCGVDYGEPECCGIWEMKLVE